MVARQTRLYEGAPVSPRPSLRPRRRGRAAETVIEAAKRRVKIEEFARQELGPGVGTGKEIRFVCRLHNDHDPSLRVNTEKGLWYCDPCSVGGDVVRLAELLWDHARADVAAAEALMLFGHEVPRRPASWFARQERQRPLRDGLGRIETEVLRRRLFRILEPMISGVADRKERLAEAEYVWRELTPLAALTPGPHPGSRRSSLPIARSGSVGSKMPCSVHPGFVRLGGPDRV